MAQLTKMERELGDMLQAYFIYLFMVYLSPQWGPRATGNILLSPVSCSQEPHDWAKITSNAPPNQAVYKISKIRNYKITNMLIHHQKTF